MGIRKVNLSDLQGSLSKKGRDRYADPILRDALLAMMSDGEPFIWEDAVVTGKTEKQVTASKAKWRSRAVSVFKSLGLDDDKSITIRWTTDDEMVIAPKA